jgi:hypothetical protein
MKTSIQIAIENIDQCLNADDTKDMLINLLEKEKEQIIYDYMNGKYYHQYEDITAEEYYNNNYGE